MGSGCVGIGDDEVFSVERGGRTIEMETGQERKSERVEEKARLILESLDSESAACIVVGGEKVFLERR